MKNIGNVLIGLSLLILSSTFLNAQNYEANWESLDQRPVPEWFEDAKFGIFIHWGPYSVPAWSPKGTYSEWYQFWLQNKALFGNGNFKGDEVYQYHKKTYGAHFDYYEFGDMFTADLFDPEEWAGLFEEAGAKYIVLTSKHHDGYTLWPNEQANDRGFAWNSMEVGAKRDLVGELSAAVKNTSVKMGLYYSLYEWYHPLWLSDKDRFVDEHYLPQIKDLVQNYQPDILWTDGEWEMEGEKWKSEEFLAWLYNESAAKDNILVNDRWGKGLRQKHGGYYTTEYEAGKVFDKPWEECRGMGFSFGYNQNEDAQDYNSTQALILMLVDIVSNGGNLLLDIGPDARGNIPPIMQERLLEIGEWLKVNGEAIYGSRKWERAAQWSEGDRSIDHKKGYLGGDYILKQTIDPAPGKAVKELFFTIKGDDLFAISPKFHKKQLVIDDVKVSKDTKVSLLGHEGELTYKVENRKLVIEMPELSNDELPCENAWAFKISHIK
ncbi:alpha-L-fucosidase [Echinicola shivajiensis]|uniref:alpha-L-fucosidase n=1 Tax=Echinicola shivajiensis TaxID=1035916 RepID=UPI001BFC4BD6|nr:alpha-L-fucosidase [Echinicola shivajiensis]